MQIPKNLLEMTFEVGSANCFLSTKCHTQFYTTMPVSVFHFSLSQIIQRVIKHAGSFRGIYTQSCLEHMDLFCIFIVVLIVKLCISTCSGALWGFARSFSIIPNPCCRTWHVENIQVNAFPTVVLYVPGSTTRVGNYGKGPGKAPECTTTSRNTQLNN